MSVNCGAGIPQSAKSMAMSWMISVQFLTGIVLSFFTMPRPTLVSTPALLIVYWE
jgi:hypothetical protein